MPAPGFKTITVSQAVFDALHRQRSDLVARGMAALPPDLAAAYQQALLDLRSRGKVLGISVLVALGAAALDREMAKTAPPARPASRSPKPSKRTS